ncbi:putative DNA-binding protein [Actinacidiphila reveromycinica]|uniref:Putative DNA-binding protein n=1 Tax=Actinacidiphila reveromycinica TaxID=659352 RepID=A0A7U3VL75_9ACTN|nr:putative DNA-binding protein [Streptomyces sp. SN-593]
MLRVAPMTGETTWSYLSRLAGRYGMEPAALLPWWTWSGSRPQDEGGPRDDAEVLLSPAGRRLLAQLGGVAEHDLARALPAFNDEPRSGTPDRSGETAGSGRPAGRWKVASAGEHGPVAYGCALCAAARTGQDTVVVRYVAPWQRACARHQRWMLTAGDGHRHHHLDLRAAPEVAAAQRAWPKVARVAAAAGADPGRVFTLAHAVVCAWWEQALQWERERIWPARLHAVAGGDAGPRFWWWRIIARDAVVFPETVTLAGALLDPGMQERIWEDHGAGGLVRPFRPDGAFFRELTARLGRPWLADTGQAPQTGLVLGGPLHAGPLLECMGAFTRIRRGQQHPRGYGLDPWWLRADHRPASGRVQLRALAERATQSAAGRGTGRSGGAVNAGGGALMVRRLFRDRHGRAGVAYTAAPPPPQ